MTLHQVDECGTRPVWVRFAEEIGNGDRVLLPAGVSLLLAGLVACLGCLDQIDGDRDVFFEQRRELLAGGRAVDRADGSAVADPGFTAADRLLRVEDHAAPIAELARLLALHRSFYQH